MCPDQSSLDRPGLVGVDHVSYTLESIADLFGNYEYLKAKGIAPEFRCIHHGDTVSMYYADPDGNQMEFQVETFEAQRLSAAAHECQTANQESSGSRIRS